MVKFLDLQKITAKYADEIHEAAARVIDSGWYLQGKENSEFEQNYASYIGSRHCIGCGNGLDALIWIFRAYIEMGVMKPGDEVLVPANTYIASILAITENGLVPVLVEPDINTLQIDGSLIESHITERTKAILIVHLYGQCAYTNKIAEITKKYSLKLVEDNAQAHGCLFEGRKTGSLGDAAGHSFYPGKNLYAFGEGGSVTCNSEEYFKHMTRLKNQGCDRRYYHDEIGYNYRLEGLQGAVLSVSLKLLPQWTARRREIGERYHREITNPMITMQYHPANPFSVL